MVPFQVNEPPPPDDILRAFWEFESLGIMDKSERRMTAEERVAVAQVSETLEVRNGQYKIGIPWKEGEPKFTNNYDVAIVRLKSQEKSLKRKGPEVMEAYNKIFQDYEKKDYIRQVPQSEVEKQWFLPHFPVVKEDRVTTKVRMVFDAAAKHDGKSLNDAIWPGPKLQRDLVDVLTRFRCAPVALSADILCAQHLRRQLSTLLAMAGFKLRKWSSNEPVVIEAIPKEDRLPTIDLDKDILPKTKTLGVMWEAERDVFTFQVQQPLINNKAQTKRNVLCAIASLFDPLQFLAPFTVRAKVLMQEIWMAGVDWDDELPENLKIKWEKWVSELPQLSNVAVPRCLRRAYPENIELHLFSDASNDAFASVAYLVCRYQDSSPSSRLIASKCRVSPVKAMTIPRLELMGAILSSRLAQNILKVISVDRTIFWTDSENVWYWVRNQSREFKPFVANPIGEIQRTSSPEQWRHVPGTSV